MNLCNQWACRNRLHWWICFNFSSELFLSKYTHHLLVSHIYLSRSIVYTFISFCLVFLSTFGSVQDCCHVAGVQRRAHWIEEVITLREKKKWKI